MKIYFAKYLPVEGEIKEGDHYLFEERTTKMVINILPDVIQMYVGQFGELGAKEYIDRHYRKVKLFLCSRDIEVGDILWSDTMGGGHYSSEFEPPKDAVKVIGEISPYAVWLKEGDEFEEDEVKMYDSLPEPIIGGIVRKMVQIKCSQCKHFH